MNFNEDSCAIVPNRRSKILTAPVNEWIENYTGDADYDNDLRKYVPPIFDPAIGFKLYECPELRTDSGFL